MKPKSIELCGLAIVGFALFVSGIPYVSGTGDSEIAPEPGPDWWYHILYDTSDGSIIAFVAGPPDSPPNTVVHEGEALIDLTGQPVAFAILADAREGRLDMWYVNLSTGIPVRTEPLPSQLPTVAPLNPAFPIALVAGLLVTGGGIGLLVPARIKRKRQLRASSRGRTEHGKW